MSRETEPIHYGVTGLHKTTKKRCFSGYTGNADKCEIYSLEDFQEHYGNGYIKCDEPVSMCPDLCRKYKKFDTVLVDADEYRRYIAEIKANK